MRQLNPILTFSSKYFQALDNKFTKDLYITITQIQFYHKPLTFRYFLHNLALSQTNYHIKRFYYMYTNFNENFKLK